MIRQKKLFVSITKIEFSLGEKIFLEFILSFSWMQIQFWWSGNVSMLQWTDNTYVIFLGFCLCNLMADNLNEISYDKEFA